MRRTLIVIPALNEAESLPSMLRELRDVLDDDFDVVVIDDGSTDATAEVARCAGATLAQLAFTLGVGGAVRVGLKYADRYGYDRAVVVDADGQHDPRGISALLDSLDRGADMAVGSRFAGEGDYPVGPARRQAMRFLGAIVRVLTGQRYSDVTSGFRAFDRPVIELLAREYPVEYLADTVEALLIVRYAGFRVDDVPIKMRPRSGGVPSTRRFRLVVNYLRLIIGILGSASRRARLRKDEA
jgi:glycosyltransferase involved in cell wall biosynthesis